MITFISGIPGSGKTYYAVRMISKLKDHSKLIHNIDSLKLGIQLHDSVVQNNFSSSVDFFRKSFHDNDQRFHGFTFVIDECQILFPKQFKDTDVIAFFDLHRHYGIDIILISQDIKKVCNDITCLAELQFRAVSGASNPIPGTLLYRQEVGGESVGRKYLIKDKRIFNLYRSSNDDSSSISRLGTIYGIVIIIGVLAFAIGLFFWFKSFKPDDPKNVNIASNETKNVHSKNSNINIHPRDFSLSRSNSFHSSLGGSPVPVGKIIDYSGSYYVLMGVIIRKELFPYKVVKSRVGEVALLPPDVYQEYLAYNVSLNEKSSPEIITDHNSDPPSARRVGERSLTNVDKEGL